MLLVKFNRIYFPEVALDNDERFAHIDKYQMKVTFYAGGVKSLPIIYSISSSIIPGTYK